MSLLEMVFGEKTRAQIGLVTFDASVSEQHTKTAEVTSYPVEDGVDITDHIRRQPEEVAINGIVSNTPICYLASLLAPSPLKNDLTSASERAELAYSEMQRVMDSGELVSVVTSLRDYDNMAIISLSVTRDAANGNVLNANVTMREVILAITQTAEAPPDPVEPARKGVQNQGAQTATAAPATTPGPSLAFGILGG